MKTENEASKLAETVLFSLFSFIVPLFGIIFAVLLLIKAKERKIYTWAKIIAIIAIISQLSFITMYSLSIVQFDNSTTSITKKGQLISD